MFKVPRAIKTIGTYGPSCLKGFVANGKYFGPLVSRRQQADLRKRALIDGTFGSFDKSIGGWDPAWDPPKKMFVIKPNKGSGYERDRQERADKITKAMATMPDKLEKNKQAVRLRKPKKDIPYIFKRVLSLGEKDGRYREFVTDEEGRKKVKKVVKVKKDKAEKKKK